MASESKVIVIDLGTEYVKAGFAGDKSPSAVFPTIVAQDTKGAYFIGNETRGTDGDMTVRYPVKKGMIKNWNDLERILQYTFTQLNVKSNDQTILFAMSFSTSEYDKTKLAHLMFNNFNVAAMYVAINNVLSLYSVGRKTGVVMEIGSGSSDCVPVNEGYPVPTAVVSANVANKLFGESEIKAIAQAIHESIKNVRASCTVATEMYKNIWLAGGRALHPGLCDLVRYELQKLTEEAVSVSAASGGGRSSWIGGSILASLDQFKGMCLTETEFKETPSSSKLNATTTKLATPTQKRTVVIDIGSAFVKVGFAGEHEPSLFVPTVVAADEKGNVFVGKDTQGREGVLKLRHPVKKGIVHDWTDMENILQHAISELNINPSEHKFLFGQSVSISTEDKEKLAEILFTKFKCPAIFMAVNNVLSLYSVGKLVGVVMEIGAGVSDCVAVNEGYRLTKSTVSSDVAGKTITEAETDKIANAISKCIANVQGDVGPEVTTALYDSIWLSGGNTSSPNLDTRVQELLEKNVNVKSAKVKVVPTGGNSAWIGGSILASMDETRNLYVYKAEYHKNAGIIGTKFA